MAWLNAVPKPDERSRRAKGPPRTTSRLDEMRKGKVAPPLPPNPAPHLLSRLMEVGITGEAGPVSWQEIDAWANRTGVDLPPWEARLMRALSVAYVIEGRRAESENAPAPWAEGTAQAAASTEQADLMSVLG